MLTTGEIISALCRFYLGVSDEQNDKNTRQKSQWFLQEGAERLWTMAPVWWKEASGGSVSVTGAQTYGTTPADFGDLGQHGQVYISGGPREPLRYATPDVLHNMLRQTTSTVSFPEWYTLETRTTAGLPKIRVALTPGGTITLLIDGYNRKTPQMIDCPVAPSVADSGVAGNLSGAYQWRVTFVTAAGETEGGYPTTTLSVTAKSVLVTNLPVPPSWLSGVVTGKKLYRTVASGVDFKLVAAMASTATLTYTDDTLDGSLGAACPTPATAIGTGVEQFPEDWQRSLIFQYAQAAVAQKQGDVRDRAWMDDWTVEARRCWATIKQGLNTVQILPRYGQRRTLDSWRSARERLSS